MAVPSAFGDLDGPDPFRFLGQAPQADPPPPGPGWRQALPAAQSTDWQQVLQWRPRFLRHLPK
eukprot:2122929-Prorocentrum_lima.AAC.1